MRFVVFLLACTDVSGFRGEWRGTPEAQTLLGMPAAEGQLQLMTVERDHLAGAFNQAPLRAMSQAAADQLGELSLPDSPLRSYWNALTLPDGDALSLVSLYNDRVDLRLIRSDTLYAVFHLTRWNGN
jgi:hypothetical protein